MGLKKPSEHQEQVAVVDWLRSRGVLVTAIPNGAKVSVKERSKLLAEGLEPGAPDLILRTPPTEAYGVLIVALEMKRRDMPGQDKARLSKSQQDWEKSVKDMPWIRYVVGYGAADAVEKLKVLGY